MSAILINILTEFNSKGVEGAIGSLKKLAKSQLGAALSAGALVDMSRRAIQAANEDAKSQRLLALAVANNTNATYDQIKGVEAYVGKLQYSALVADDELRPALGRLITVTQDVTKSQRLMSIAVDAAAYTGRDLETTTAAITKAQQGQYKALRSLGLRISDTTIKSKDFEQAMREVASQVDGANEKVNEGAQGGWKRLSIAAGDAAEVIGYELNAALGDNLDLLGNLAKNLNQTESEQGWVTRAFHAAGQAALSAGSPIKFLTALLRDNKEAAHETGVEYKTLADRYVDQLTSAYWANKDAQDAKAAADKRAAEAAKKAGEASKRLAEVNRGRLKDALKTAKDALASLRQEQENYAGSVRESIMGTVSLADAVSTAQNSEDAYTAALQERKDAYAELAKLQQVTFDAATGKTQVADAEDLAAAMERVAEAEGKVSAAQGKRKDYTAAFKEQITAARNFATSLKELVGKGLNDVGLQQLLNLGPIAGAQVAKDLLSGTGGLTVGDVNLTDLAGPAGDLGIAAGDMMFGTAIAGATNRVGAVQYAVTNNITVTSADPDKVVAALVAWSKKNGKLPATVQVS